MSTTEYVNAVWGGFCICQEAIQRDPSTPATTRLDNSIETKGIRR
jgi:hypothetical protein